MDGPLCLVVTRFVYQVVKTKIPTVSQIFPHFIDYLTLVGCPIFIEHSRHKIRGSTWVISVVHVGKPSGNFEFHNWYVEHYFTQKKHDSPHISVSQLLTDSNWLSRHETSITYILVNTYLKKKAKNTQKNRKTRTMWNRSILIARISIYSIKFSNHFNSQIILIFKSL